MPAAELQDGLYRGQRVSCQKLNYQIWAINELAKSAASMHLNLFSEDIAGIAALTGILPFGCSGSGLAGPERPIEVVIAQTGAAAPQVAYAYSNSRTWSQWGAVPGGGSTLPTGIATDVSGGVGVTMANPADRVYLSGAPGGAWIGPWPFLAAPGLAWDGIACDQDLSGGAETWVINNTISSAPHRAIGAGNNFIISGVVPGFAPAAGLVRHTHHLAGDLYSGDVGNSRFAIATATQWSTSTDGDIWTAAALHGLAAAPLDLAYSKFGMRWGKILASGGAANKFAYSDDNGANWTTIAGPGTVFNLGAGGSYAKLACDGYGTWMTAMASGGIGTVGIYASVDNGLTWSRIYSQETGGSAPSPVGCALWYGNGAFHLMTNNGGMTWFAQSSLRII
jgi:hypothetical protein